VELLSRELAVPVFKLDHWRQKADAALEGALKEREADAASIEPKNSISRAVARLLRDGRIARRADPEDGRATILDLTDAGRALHDSLLPEFRAREARMVAPLSEAERAELDRLLGKLVHREDDWAEVF
jgi:hypothetical protein